MICESERTTATHSLQLRLAGRVPSVHSRFGWWTNVVPDILGYTWRRYEDYQRTITYLSPLGGPSSRPAFELRFLCRLCLAFLLARSSECTRPRLSIFTGKKKNKTEDITQGFIHPSRRDITQGFNNPSCRDLDIVY